MYFLLQSCSGHSRRTGDIAHGDVTLLDFFTPDICAAKLPVMLLLLPLVATWLFVPLKGEGHSSFDFRRFSGRGTEKVVGDVDGVLITAFVAFVDMFTLDTEEFLEALPLGPPFRNLLCT